MSRLAPLLTAVLVVVGFAAFFMSFLFAPFAVLGVLYAVMIFGGRMRSKRRRPAPAPAKPAGAGDHPTGSHTT